MPRRDKMSPLEEAIEDVSWLCTRIPPWISIPVAVVGFLVIQWMVRAYLQAPMLKPIGNALAWVLSGFWAVVWLVGGLLGWFKRRKSTANHGRQATHGIPDRRK